MNLRYDRLREFSRREFLRVGAAGMAAFLLPGCGGGGTAAGQASNIGRLGPLHPPDANGVRLPTGFSSRIVARSTLAPVAGGPVWHDAPDGGACYAMPDGWIYVSNSELPSGGGGVRALRFDATASIVSCTVICSGTSRNCAGGKTPWGTWLTCEEDGDAGRVFECDPTGVAVAVDRPALGRFNHEAAAHCVADGRVYLTEDRSDGRLYRFTPTAPGSVATGLLEVARVAGGGPEGPVTWLPLPDPGGSPVATRFQVAASTPFDRGEGIGSWSGKVYFATTGDNRIWSYDIATQILVILYDDSTSLRPILTGVDNIEISAAGDVLVAEDGGDMQIIAITAAGSVVPVLQVTGQSASEITGPAFDPSRTRLYFSSQRGTTGAGSGGITYEVTGPFVV